MIRDHFPIPACKTPSSSERVCPSLLEPARVQPDYEMADDMADYAASMGREALEGMLVVDCPEASHG